jgi:hypothetical protein
MKILATGWAGAHRITRTRERPSLERTEQPRAGGAFFHFGASIKDAGNKGFMFSNIEESFIQRKLLHEFEIQWEKSNT